MTHKTIKKKKIQLLSTLIYLLKLTNQSLSNLLQEATKSHQAIMSVWLRIQNGKACSNPCVNGLTAKLATGKNSRLTGSRRILLTHILINMWLISVKMFVSRGTLKKQMPSLMSGTTRRGTWRNGVRPVRPRSRIAVTGKDKKMMANKILKSNKKIWKTVN